MLIWLKFDDYSIIIIIIIIIIISPAWTKRLRQNSHARLEQQQQQLWLQTFHFTENL